MHHKKDHLDIPNIEGMWFDLNQQTAAQLQEYKLVSKVLDRFVDEKLLDFKFPVVDPEFISSLEGKLNIFPITPQRAYLYSLISKEECNSFGLYTFLYKGSKEHRQGFGLALYPSPVYFNHGCDPNVGRIYTAEGKMHFFAIKPIEKSQEACITYIDLDWDLDKRQKVLKEYFCFECVCSRCTEERKFKEDNLRVKLNSLALCGANGCKASLKPLRKNQWECIGCSITVEL